MNATNFIVIFDDDQGIAFPMGPDSDCDGALCCMEKSVAFFSNRKNARKAIIISERFAALNAAQGKIVNRDFAGDAKKCVRIVPCVLMGGTK